MRYTLARNAFAGASAAPRIEQGMSPGNRAIPSTLRVAGSQYVWSWKAADDRFRIEDKNGREIAAAMLQPGLALYISGREMDRPGVLRSVSVADGRIDFVYEREDAKITVTVGVRFADDRFWYEPVRCQSQAAVDAIEVRWFGGVDEQMAEPGLSNQFLVLPGFSMSEGVSPVVTAEENLDQTVWIGRGASPSPGMFQQWALPVHYFAAFNREGADGARDLIPGKLSAAFCCGLESLPDADMLLHTKAGRHSLIFRYHGELWGHARTPGQLSLGGRLVWTFAASWREAVRAYYWAVRDAGAIQIQMPSDPKRAVMTGTAFSMWGAQLASGKIGGKLVQAELNGIYRSFRGTGLKMDTFLIEDRWESFPGSLVHDEKRFPQFEDFLACLRGDDMSAALWVMPLRCQSPQLIGLQPQHLLRSSSAVPTSEATPETGYSILDVSQPAVAENLTRRLQAMMRRYRPSYIKFDFGYEMPPLSLAAPADRAFAGERMLLKAAGVPLEWCELQFR